MKKAKGYLILGIALLVLFGLFTVLVQTVDVQAIGPENSEVGFAGINGFFRDKIGQNETWYKLSEVLGYAALLAAAGFAVLGVIQVIKRKSLRIDPDLYALAGLYVLVGAFYVLFEMFVVNCRPVLEDGVLEASYPSSHTLLGLCIMGSALLFVGKKIPCRRCRWPWMVLGTIVLLGILVGRTLSGVHWITDIFASVLLSGGLLALFAAALNWKGTKSC